MRWIRDRLFQLCSASIVAAVFSAWLWSVHFSPTHRAIRRLMWEPFDESTALLAIEELNAIGPASVPALVKELRCPQPHRQAMAAEAIAFMGEKACDATPALIEALNSPHHLVRSKAATALGSIGPAATAAVPALQDATKDSHRWVREAATWALERLNEIPTQ